jgi:hypothetical protein
MLCMCIIYVYLAARYINTFDHHHHHPTCVCLVGGVFFVHLWYFCSGCIFFPQIDYLKTFFLFQIF